MSKCKPLNIQSYHKPKDFVYHARWTNPDTNESGEIICTSYQAFNNNIRHTCEEEFRKTGYKYYPRLNWQFLHKTPKHLKHWRTGPQSSDEGRR